MIEHCLREQDFRDDFIFYRFIEDTDRGATPMKGNRALSRGGFIAPALGSGNNLMPNIPSTDIEAIPGNAANVASAVSPMDEHNIRLLDNVHPPEWIDPEIDGVYNMVVISAGAGGLVTSASAAGAGAKAALFSTACFLRWCHYRTFLIRFY